MMAQRGCLMFGRIVNLSAKWIVLNESLREISLSSVSASASLRIAAIWLSLNFDFFVGISCLPDGEAYKGECVRKMV